MLALPGVVPEPGTGSLKLDEEWPVMERVLERGPGKAPGDAHEEGRAMAQELLSLRDHIAGQLASIRRRRRRWRSCSATACSNASAACWPTPTCRLTGATSSRKCRSSPSDSDIAEEVVRLASHLDQFQLIVNEPESPGRKLEFLTQEMFRETNTIGSKASDVEISRHVVEIKGTLEKIRELIQNVE